MRIIFKYFEYFKYFEVEGRMLVDRLRKTWHEVLRKDLESQGIDRQVVLNYVAWQDAMRWQKLTHVNMEPGFQNHDDDNDLATAIMILQSYMYHTFLDCCEKFHQTLDLMKQFEYIKKTDAVSTHMGIFKNTRHSPSKLATTTSMCFLDLM